MGKSFRLADSDGDILQLIGAPLQIILLPNADNADVKIKFQYGSDTPVMFYGVT